MVRVFLWVVMLFGGGAAGFWLDRAYFEQLLVSPIFHLLTLLPGILLLRLVLRSSRNTGRQLARLGRKGNVPRMNTNRLVTTGYYACMRHPMHFGLLFFPLALALILGSVSFIVFIAPLEMLFVILMIKWIEEPETVRKFGQAYLDYRKAVPMFSLRWSCLKKLFGKVGLNRRNPGVVFWDEGLVNNEMEKK